VAEVKLQLARNGLVNYVYKIGFMPRCAIPRVFRVPNTLNGALRVPPLPPARRSFSAYLLMIYRLKISQKYQFGKKNLRKCYSFSQFNKAAAGGAAKSKFPLLSS